MLQCIIVLFQSAMDQCLPGFNSNIFFQSQVPQDLPVRKTGREVTPTMPERTIASSVVFATLARHLANKEVYGSTRVTARRFLRQIVGLMVSSVPGINLMIVNVTNFLVSRETLSDDGCLPGLAVWGPGSPLAHSCIALWRKAFDTRLYYIVCVCLWG